MVLGTSIWVRLKKNESDEFCRKILSLDTGVFNIVVNPDSKIRVHQGEDREEVYTPYELLCIQDKYQVLIYVGITGQVDSDCPGEYIWKKYGCPSKLFAMLDDGWIILKDVVQFLKYDFLCRRYTTAWTKRLLQLYIETFGHCVTVQWLEAEQEAYFRREQKQPQGQWNELLVYVFQTGMNSLVMSEE